MLLALGQVKFQSFYCLFNWVFVFGLGMGCIFVGFHCLFVGFGGFCFNCDFVLGLVLICWFGLPFFQFMFGCEMG